MSPTLTSIIETSGATIGDVILARVDVATQQVTGTRRFDPAYGCGDEDSLAAYEERRDRSTALCVAARALAPSRGSKPSRHRLSRAVRRASG